MYRRSGRAWVGARARAPVDHPHLTATEEHHGNWHGVDRSSVRGTSPEHEPLARRLLRKFHYHDRDAR